MKGAAFALALAASTVAADAASVTVRDFDGNKAARVLTVDGEIFAGDDAKVERVLAAALASDSVTPLFVELTSPGGDTDASIGIARLVRRVGVGVLVRGDCTSGCAEVALSARRGNLFVVEHGAVGVHQSWRPGPHGEVRAAADGTERAAQCLRDSGVPEAILAKMYRTPPTDISYLSDAELRSLGALVKR